MLADRATIKVEIEYWRKDPWKFIYFKPCTELYTLHYGVHCTRVH